jgi:hypothetical protein
MGAAMSDETRETAKESFEAVELVEVALHPGEIGRPLYTLVLMNEDAREGRDRPLTDEEGYIVWFADPRDAGRALALGDEGIRGHAPPPTEVAASYDFATMFWMLIHETVDDGYTIDTLNLLLDLVEATEFPYPPEYQRRLFSLADHLTFSRNLGEFLDAGEGMRAPVMDAVTWAIGAVAIKSRLLPPE